MKQKQSKILVGAIFLIISFNSHSQDINQQKLSSQKTGREMEALQIIKNKEIVRHLYEEVLNKRKLEVLETIIAEDFISIRGEKGVAGFKEQIAALHTAFPDAKWEVEELIAEGDKVVVKQVLRGTHKGQFQNINATGKTVINNGIGIYYLKNNKIVDNQIHTDRLAFLQQLEVLPQDLSSISNKEKYKQKVVFIDKFFVPAAGKEEFLKRMKINLEFIEKLGGFIEHTAYEHTDNTGNLSCITIAVWENNELLSKAKEAVQAEYKRTEFDPLDFYRKFGIKLDRDIFKEM